MDGDIDAGATAKIGETFGWALSLTALNQLDGNRRRHSAVIVTAPTESTV